MRAFAAAQFTVIRFGLWRWAVFSLGCFVALAVGGWLVHEPPLWRHALLPCAALVAALTVWVVAVQPRPEPLSLRWDSQRWHLGPAETVGHEPWVGELAVAIDLGTWMLLRFRPEGGPRGVPNWLPVQRRGLESHWHALRCAVYSPRPDAGVDAAPDV